MTKRLCYIFCLLLAAGTCMAQDGLRVRFLGTGAALWDYDSIRERRNSAVLLDNSTLIDLTQSALAMLPKGAAPKVIFYTHSHNDHYQPAVALRAGVQVVYLGETWYNRAVKDFAAASVMTGLPMPTIIPMAVGEKVTVNGLTFTALPGNHVSYDIKEQCLIYLVEKQCAKRKVRLLYATDTGGILGTAARLAGIDSHVANGTPITALIMEATMGMSSGDNGDEDYRIFSHSSVATVARTTNMLLRTKRYLPAQGQKVYLTHIANLLYDYPTQADLNQQLPEPLAAAYDGLEVLFE